jgi:hypothetical protein
MGLDGRPIVQHESKFLDMKICLHIEAQRMPISVATLALTITISMEVEKIDISYKPVGIVAVQEFILGWARGLGVSNEGCAKLICCLDIDYLLSLPRNFKNYRRGNFHGQAHAQHLWYCNVARVVGWHGTRHQFPSAILALIKYKVWSESKGDGKFRHAKVCPNAEIMPTLGGENGECTIVVFGREAARMDPASNLWWIVDCRRGAASSAGTMQRRGDSRDSDSNEGKEFEIGWQIKRKTKHDQTRDTSLGPQEESTELAMPIKDARRRQL